MSREILAAAILTLLQPAVAVAGEWGGTWGSMLWGVDGATAQDVPAFPVVAAAALGALLAARGVRSLNEEEVP